VALGLALNNRKLYAEAKSYLLRSLEIEQHLQECSVCAETHKHLQALRQTIQSAGLYARAPLNLHERIRASLHERSQTDRIGETDQAARAVKPGAVFRELPWRWFGIAASFAIVAIIGWSIFRVSSSSAENMLAQEVISSHVRSLMANHLMDVASSDQHNVKPWFNGQLDFSPTVKDLAGEGFPLVGGRLDYIDNRTIAALVYKRHQHVINLFIWPAADTEEPLRNLTRQGYHAIHWTQGGFTYWAVSDLNEQELQEFTRLIQQK
jgi:anti-sigma factor RsiW